MTLLFSHDFRISHGGVGGSFTNGPGERRVQITDAHDSAPSYVQEAEVVNGALRAHDTSPVNTVVVLSHDLEDSYRAGFMHAGYTDNATESDCTLSQVNIICTTTTGTGYVAHFVTEWSGSALTSSVWLGRDVSGTFNNDHQQALSAVLQAGDLCEFDVTAGSPNTLRAYVNGTQVASHTDSSLTPSDAEAVGFPCNTDGLTQTEWLPGVHVVWATTGESHTPPTL